MDGGGSNPRLDLRGALERSFSVRWFDPRTGQSQTSRAIHDGATVSLRSPFENEAVVHLKRIR